MTDLRKLLSEARENLKTEDDCRTLDEMDELNGLKDRIDAALAEKVEPVAWRWKYVGGDYWHFGADKPKFAAPESNFIVEPLYAAPALPEGE